MWTGQTRLSGVDPSSAHVCTCVVHVHQALDVRGRTLSDVLIALA